MTTQTSDPWAAIDAASDPVRHALRLARLNESARGGRRMGAEVRSVVDRSWQRSAAAGVDPDLARPRAPLQADVLERRRRTHPLAVVRPTLARVLTDLTSSAPHVFALSDARGMLLWVDGSDEAVERAGGEMAFEAGSDWSERAAGTNAVGTALVEEHAVQIFSAEHFRPAVHGWTCSASPIRCPETGEILGVLDATADLRTVDPRTLPYLVGATRAAERVLRGQAERRDLRLRALVRQRPAGAPRPELALSPLGRIVPVEHPGARSGLGSSGDAGDPTRRWRLPQPPPEGGPIRLPDGRMGHAEPAGGDGFLVYADHATSRPRPVVSLELLGTHSPLARKREGAQPLSRGHAEILALLVHAPGGLTAERLAVLLHGDRANPGTARAACSRLRTRLPGVVLTRPYRLAPGIGSDLRETQQHLRGGDLSSAVELYRGPLLPDSAAPGVREIADDLHAELRGALLEAGDAEALAAWCATPHGSDDLLAAEALVKALPHGDPRRGAAAGRIASLRRRLGIGWSPATAETRGPKG
ncbi:transcriptional regulator [Patulibacter sp. NPDC049589]|uniref:transcriptional regulator n=1 Tax=Patulibacter sp. NPDC049589 TaxID=3154731 RepID=UPI00342B998F